MAIQARLTTPTSAGATPVGEPHARRVSPVAVGPGTGTTMWTSSEPDARPMLNALGVAVYTTDPEGHVIFYNEAAAQFWGRRPELGELWCGSYKLFHPDGTPMPHDTCPMAIALREGRELRGVEAIAERPDGTRVAFTPYPTVLRDPDGTIVGAVNVLVDVTDRARVEDSLRATAEALRASNAVKDEFLGPRLARAAHPGHDDLRQRATAPGQGPAALRRPTATRWSPTSRARPNGSSASWRTCSC